VAEPSGGVRRISSGGPWEESVGFSRAVVAGPFVLVAGSTAMVDGSVQHEGDPYEQTRAAFGVAERALEQAGCTLADVVQTRIYVTHISDAAQVGRAHRDLFGEVRPVSTLIQVAGLVDSRMLVEVEVVAYRPGA
jgi:enamine deaminase RidA (YjgF/YER057c/UK114 family)